MASINRERFDGLKELEQDQPGFMKELVELFIQTSTKKLATIKEMIDRKDPQAVGLEAHALKSSAANMGADSMASLCSKLESAGKLQDLSEAAGDWTQLKKEFELAQAELKNLL